jgi:hypothetical protein
MRVELMSNLSTDASQKGDRFEAKVLEPKEFEGAILQGSVARVQRPGRAKGTAELQLSFEEIRFPDGRAAKMSAQVIEVLQTGTSDGVGKVDSEGGVQGKDSTKDDVKKVGIGAGVGAVIGAIFGGGSGAAIGATIGAGVGTGRRAARTWQRHLPLSRATGCVFAQRVTLKFSNGIGCWVSGDGVLNSADT